MDMQQAIAKLAQSGVGFYVSHPDHSGAQTVHLEANRLEAYIADPVAFFAKHYGITKEEYLDWHRSEYRVQCAGKTSAGKRCKNTVPDGTSVNPKPWVKMQGGYCTLHGG